MQEIGAESVGIRLSPYGTFNDATDADPHSLFTYLCAEIRERGIAYVHMIESRVNGATDLDPSCPQVIFTIPRCFVFCTAFLVNLKGLDPDGPRDERKNCILCMKLYMLWVSML